MSKRKRKPAVEEQAVPAAAGREKRGATPAGMIIGGIVVLGLIVAGIWGFGRYARDGQAAPQFERITTGPKAGYVGQAACADCHDEIAETYKEVAMGRSLYRPAETNIIENYTTASEFYHEPSRQYFKMTYENGRFFQARWQKGPGGQKINELKAEANYVMGSGNHARSYVHTEPDGKAYQLPVAWYPQEQKWAMNPGYDNAVHSGFSRRITYDCAFCHAAAPEIPEGLDRFNYAESSLFPKGMSAIDCERCHGPGAKHVELAQTSNNDEEIRSAIVNPGKLSTELHNDVCMQCHLETTSNKLPHSVFVAGSHIYGFKPGEKLADYRIALDHPPGVHDDKFEIASQAYRMRKSKCFTHSGKMTCTTCHNPHKVPEDRIKYQIANCMKCHTPAECTETPPKRMVVQDNCIQCHMPSRRTDDVIHVVMTDHFIQRHKPERDLLAMHPENLDAYKGEIRHYYPETMAPDLSDLYLGIGYVSDQADVDKGIQLLSRYLDRYPDNKLMEPVFYRGVGFKSLEQHDRAKDDILKTLSLVPDVPQVHMALGDVYENMKDNKTALDHYNQAARLAPFIARAFNGVGINKYLLGDKDGAREAYQKAADLDPFDYNAFLNLATVSRDKQDYAAAEKFTRDALAITPINADGFVALAVALSELNRYPEAAWYLAEALRLAPNKFKLYPELGNFARSSGAEQDRVLQEITELLPFEGRVLAAAKLHSSGARDLAAQKLAEALDIPTSDIMALNHGGRIAAELKRTDVSEQFYQGTLRNYSADEEAVSGYATALAARQKGSDAIKFLVEALERNQSPLLLNTLAYIRAAGPEDVRNGVEAETIVRDVMKRLQHPNVYVYRSLAAALAEQGRFDEAMKSVTEGQALARKDSRDDLVELLAGDLELYKVKQPLRL